MANKQPRGIRNNNPGNIRHRKSGGHFPAAYPRKITPVMSSVCLFSMAIICLFPMPHLAPQGTLSYKFIRSGSRFKANLTAPHDPI